MAEVIISLPAPLNASVQTGDVAHYVPVNVTVGGFQTHTDNANITTIGTIKKIEYQDSDGNTVSTPDNLTLFGDDLGYTALLTCDIGNFTPLPQQQDFFFFSKDRTVNEANAMGYYAEFKFVNDSRKKAELFSVGCDIGESSK
tara:strand:+ start:230 stop:658 length:429 start_codon:yes stop_codon:yes gene_type:complete